jgi:hypothetical protein
MRDAKNPPGAATRSRWVCAAPDVSREASVTPRGGEPPSELLAGRASLTRGGIENAAD